MKKFLIATTALVASTGFAAAQGVSFSGSAGFGYIFNGVVSIHDYYAQIDIDLRGETDMGLAFGADFSLSFLNSASDASVFIEGGFGKFSVGNVDNAIEAVVNGTADVGYSGLGVDNLAEDNLDWSDSLFLYEGSFGDFSVAASSDGNVDWGVAGSYAFNTVTVSAGFSYDGFSNQYALGATADIGEIGVDVLYSYDDWGAGFAAYGVSGDYTMGAVTVTASYGHTDWGGVQDGYGLGISYDLGGGATIDAGVASINSVTMYDFGINMEF